SRRKRLREACILEAPHGSAATCGLAISSKSVSGLYLPGLDGLLVPVIGLDDLPGPLVDGDADKQVFQGLPLRTQLLQLPAALRGQIDQAGGKAFRVGRGDP